MIKSVEIKNFRGFEYLKVDGIAPVNLIVGDNAVGKTAFLEAIFLTLCGDAGKGLNLKQWRGMDATFQGGSANSVVEGIYSDLFHDSKSPESIFIQLTGEGFQNRKLVIARTPREVFVPTKAVTPNRHTRRAQRKVKRQTPEIAESVVVPIILTWTDYEGAEHISRVHLSSSGIRFETTSEKLEIAHMFAAQVAISSEHTANLFSDLKKARDADRFISGFRAVFDWVQEIYVGSIGNSPVLMADVPWAKQPLPLPALSGGTNRAASILLALATSPGPVLVDEVESGIFHTRQARFARALLDIAGAYKGQVIMTSHSNEWISNFLDAVGPREQEIAMWRMERIDDGPPRIRRFTVGEYKAGLSLGDMR